MRISLEELLERRHLERAELMTWIERRWVLPAREGETFVFDEIDVARAELIRDMRRDLMVDEETLPLLLSLIDQIHALRAELGQLFDAVCAQPDPVRREILARLKREP